ncbi:MAG: hypothetical protein ACYC7L_02860 [Nitrospirota bacterium]
MARKIAVLVRDRQEEALRMAVGATLRDDVIDVYVLDRSVEATEGNTLNIETLRDLDMRVWSNVSENAGLEFCSTEELARRLPGYDHILAY